MIIILYISQRKMFSFPSDNLFILQERNTGNIKFYTVWTIFIIVKNITQEEVKASKLIVEIKRVKLIK